MSAQKSQANEVIPLKAFDPDRYRFWVVSAIATLTVYNCHNIVLNQNQSRPILLLQTTPPPPPLAKQLLTGNIVMPRPVKQYSAQFPTKSWSVSIVFSSHMRCGIGSTNASALSPISSTTRQKTNSALSSNLPAPPWKITSIISLYSKKLATS